MNQGDSQRSKCKGLIFGNTTLSGPKQMAIDEMMLEKVLKNKDIHLTIRFYKWDGHWVSIGKNQKDLPKGWYQLIKEKKIQVVRRPSGGKAVLHGSGLTYCISWSNPPRRKRQAYFEASHWLVQSFQEIGVKLAFGNDLENQHSANCFASATNADLIDNLGHKRVGSAQFWKKGHLLQHGEILLNPPKDLWMELFNEYPPEPLKSIASLKDLERLFIKNCMCYWKGIMWDMQKITKEELNFISKESSKYKVNLIN